MMKRKIAIFLSLATFFLAGCGPSMDNISKRAVKNTSGISDMAKDHDKIHIEGDQESPIRIKGTEMEKTLNISLIHLNVKYKEPDKNRARLIELNREAAKKSRLIVNTEMAVSGYSFQSLDDIAGYAEPGTGPTITALREIARTYGTYICIGFAERDEPTGIFYNAAYVIGAEGEILLRYRKVSAEAKWACPGSGVTDNTFETPWGRVGVLICSDSYFGLFARQTTLRGARMILVPANWPETGLDPRNIWKTRAMENGVSVVACNRGGKNRLMTCDKAWSGAFTPTGEEVFSRCSFDSVIFSFEVPLENGQLPGSYRAKRMEERTPRFYRPIYLDTRNSDYGGGDFTSYYEMPEPGASSVTCFAGDFHNMAAWPRLVDAIENVQQAPGFHCFILPEISGGLERESLENNPVFKSLPENVAVFTGYREENGDSGVLMITAKDKKKWHPNSEDKDGAFPILTDVGPLRVGISDTSKLVHPETAMAYSKLGADLILVSAGRLDAASPLLFGAKAIEQTAIAVAGHNMAFICEPPEGHQPWREEKILEPGICHMDLNSEKTRKKRFLDRVDFELLLKKLP